MTRRRGTNMVEVLAVITISTIVLSSLGATLHQTMRQSHTARRSVKFQRTVARLSRTFRSDVHQSQNVTASDGTIELSGPGVATVYTWVEKTLERTRTAGERTHRDVFALPDGCQGRFAVLNLDAASSPRRLVQLWLELPNPTLHGGQPVAGSPGSQVILLEAIASGDGYAAEPSS